MDVTFELFFFECLPSSPISERFFYQPLSRSKESSYVMISFVLTVEQLHDALI